MDKQFRYRQKNVHDFKVDEGWIRLWSVDGLTHQKLIESAYRPLLRAGHVHPYIAVMPDYHPSGEGTMIGSVIPTRAVLLPQVIGGDLGCGMTAVRLPVTAAALAPRLVEIRSAILARVPVGASTNTEVTDRVKAYPIWARQLRAPLSTSRFMGKLRRQLGSLGGGNHFIELQEDTNGQAWVMLHSGSRFLGVAVRDHYVEAGAKQREVDARQFAWVAYLPRGAPIADDYLADLQFAVDFARASRHEMLLRILEVLESFSSEVKERGAQTLADEAHDTVHNFIAEEQHFGESLLVHRKGAIRVRAGDIGLVPGSMGTRSFVVEGRGNPFSFASCSHGAGRDRSRGDAFREISETEFARSMAHVVYDHDDRLRDEAPAAYKDISRVMRAQKDNVCILEEVRSMASIKGVG